MRWVGKKGVWEQSNADLTKRTMLDYCVRALALREEQKMPEVGYALDRRTLETLGHYSNDGNVHSLICFV